MKKFLKTLPARLNVYGFIAFVMFAWVLWPHIASRMFVGTRHLTLEQRGQFGDSFGTLNTLFTGLAFAGVAATLYWQFKDRQERERERDEERQQRYVDGFESRFFRLNDSLRQVVGAMVTTTRSDNGRHVTDKVGKDVFGRYVEDVRIARLDLVLTGPQLTPLEKALAKFSDVFSDRQDDLAPYFRMLYQIIRYVDRSNIPNKTDFTDIVRAELSPSETQLLALNCLTEYGEKFKPLVERYHLLKHLPEDERGLDKNLFLASFDRSAFFDDDDSSPDLSLKIPERGTQTV